jgi:hypothetical protein
MKILLHQILLLKIEKKIHQLVEKNQYFKEKTSLSNEYIQWKFADFEHLAEIINGKTIKLGDSKNNISISTLQRIFKKKDKQKEYVLKKKTKHSLASFLEYDTWEKLENHFIKLIIENIALDENLRKQISQTIAKKI